MVKGENTKELARLPHRLLEALDRLDRDGVDPALAGQLQGDEIAKHRRQEQARDPGLAGGLHPHDGGGVRGHGLRRQLEAPALSRVLVAILEEDGCRAGVAGAGPAAELVVVGVGQLGIEAGELDVLVDLGLPAAGDRSRQVGAVDDGYGTVEPRGDIGCEGLEALGLLLEKGGGSIDLGLDAGSGAGQSSRLGRGGEHVGDRGARLEYPRQADHRHPCLTRFVDQRAAGADDYAVRAERLGGGEAGQRLLGPARIARAQYRPLRGRPAGQLVAPDGDQRAGQPVADRGGGEVAADRRAAHPADHHAGCVAGLQARGLDPPEGVAKLVGYAEDVVDHGAWAGTLSSAPTMAPESSAPAPTVTPGARTEPPTRAPSPRLQSSSRTDSRTSAPAATRQPPETTARGPTLAPSAISAPAATSRPGAVGRTRVATLPSRMSQLACR